MSELTEFQRLLEMDRIYIKGDFSRLRAFGGTETMRLMKWNIERGRYPETIVRTIVQIRPDIVCLQEVDWGNTRTQSRDVLGYLAERTGMIGLFAFEFLEIESPGRPRQLAGGGATGNALLTRFAPTKASRLVLPACLDWE
jgi:endonuclease/exonuclease/phosphatase family metal-dependent hydrolase